ncbi:hypothetical protein CKW00_05890 [Salimicrobium humidisoli]|uniref:Uncharacterized protein n=1 Tax=Salimicrobium humidisoli TaxID=2029857 RepID=A0ABX4HT59_9BACI|nr:hypothetical protein CKW00_05890 [Salimicrobium humidisoli]
MQLDKEKRKLPFRSSGLSWRFAFQAAFPEKEATAWTADFWVVKLDKEKRRLPFRSAGVCRSGNVEKK